MKLTLDSSHHTVLENLGTFLRAQRCMDEVGAYLWDILREVADELSANCKPPLEFELNKEGWLQANKFPDWQGTNLHLISIGLEKLAVADIIAADPAEGCRAYIYSRLLANSRGSAAFATLTQNLRSLQPPKGFLSAPRNLHGYLFVKNLGNLTVDSFCTRSTLKDHFQTSLTELAEWLAVNTPALAALREPKAGDDHAFGGSEAGAER